MKTWTVDDLMVTTISRTLTDDDVCMNGAASFIPVTAIGLARRTHAPDLIHLGAAVGYDSQWEALFGSTVGPAYWDGATALFNHPNEFWPYLQTGRITTTFHRAAQIDARGNLNNSVIRTGEKTVRLPGGAGMPDTGALAERIVIWSTTHNRRTLVEKVDFVTMPGHLHAAGDRERWGMPGGPVLMVTDLAVMDFDETGRMRLKSVHPGISLDRVMDNTGFELGLPADGVVPETSIPTEAELKLISQMDPHEYRKSEFREGVPTVPAGRR